MFTYYIAIQFKTFQWNPHYNTIHLCCRVTSTWCQVHSRKHSRYHTHQCQKTKQLRHQRTLGKRRGNHTDTAYTNHNFSRKNSRDSNPTAAQTRRLTGPPSVSPLGHETGSLFADWLRPLYVFFKKNSRDLNPTTVTGPSAYRLTKRLTTGP